MRFVLALAMNILAAAGASAQAPPLYYCDTWGAYYPSVRSCPVPWRAVWPNAQAPSASMAQQAQTNAEFGNSCGQPEISDPAIVGALNAKIGQFGGPSRRVSAIQTAPPLDQDTSERHTRCHGTLIFVGGGTETGLLLRDSVNGVFSWRWHSDKSLAEGSAQKQGTAEIIDQMRRDAESTPNKIVGCGVEGPESIYTTSAVCYAVIRFDIDNQDKLIPYAGYAILQDCGRLSSSVCLGIIEELQSLARVPESKMALTEKCADDLEMKFPGNEKPQYMNSCQELINYFR
jgi:hypothetical protein